MASKRMKDEASQPSTTKDRVEEDMMAELRRKKPSVPQGAVVISPSKQGKKDTTTPTPRPRNPYIPCQPPTIRQGNVIQAIPVIWKIVDLDTSGGKVAAVRVESSYETMYPPERRTSNPHWCARTTVTPMDAIRKNPKIPYTKGPMPNYVVPESVIYGNVDSHVTRHIKEAEESFTTAIPFGAGNQLYDDEPRLMRVVETFLKCISSAEEGTLAVSPPVAEGRPPYRARYAKPFAMVIQGMSEGLREAVLTIQTFAFRYEEKPYAFFFVNPNDLVNSWVICNFRGGLVTRDKNEMKKALGAIVRKLLSLPMARGTANELLKEEGIGRNAEERVHLAVSSMTLVLIERINANGKEDPVWQLQGRPMTNDMANHRKWLRVVRQTKYFIAGTSLLETEKNPVACVWCKLETHTSENCPFPELTDWKGPPNEKGYHEPEPRDTRLSPKSKEGKRGKKDKQKSKGEKGAKRDGDRYTNNA